jgi:GH24 family phage-related lysozyme (muramidase)
LPFFGLAFDLAIVSLFIMNEPPAIALCPPRVNRPPQYARDKLFPDREQMKLGILKDALVLLSEAQYDRRRLKQGAETMGYSLKVTLDTWLKLSTDQGSRLSEDQKQYVTAGAVLPIASFEAVGTDHIRVAFGQDSQGRQVFFKGRNTWLAYRPTVQVLHNGKVVPVVNDTIEPTFALKVIIDTWFKLSTVQSSLLPNEQKQFFDAGRVVPISDYNQVKDDHLKVTFGLDNQGKQMTLKGRNTWYVYRPMVQLFRDGKVISFASQSTGKINANGLLLLKSFEGLRLESYLDAVGIWTIGYGTTANVVQGMRISQAQAEAFLMRDLATFEQTIASTVKVPLNSDQLSALVSFTYNVGSTAFAESTLLQLLNKNDYIGAADQMLRWNKGDNLELPGLTRRRQAERSLFLGQNFTVFL